MAELTDYLDIKTLLQLQEAFSAVARVPIRLCNPDGQPPAAPASAAESREKPPSKRPAGKTKPACDVPIVINDAVVGRVVLESVGRRSRGAGKPPASAVPTRLLRYLALMASMIARLCDRENQLRTRVQELATLYKLTTAFTGQRDLQALLDLVAKTVVEVLKGKACSIRLLSEDRTELLMKAVANLSPSYLNKGPILVSRSTIDKEALETFKPVYIADEGNDPRVLYPAEARQEGIISALCAPLVYRGKAEGVIHVYTAEPHEFDWFEVSLLQAVAAEATAAIVNTRLYEEAVRNANMRRQLRLAAEVQRQMIPDQPPALPKIQIGAVYVPSFELSGDFYDFIDLPPDNVGIVVCDVVGKGVRASLLMASIRASLRAHAVNIYSMSDVLGRVNRDLCADSQVSDFATLFYGVLDYKTRRFTCSNAGHVPPMLFRNGKISHLNTGGGILGIDAAARWKHESFTLAGGDVLLLCTDGLIEAMNFEDTAFGRERAEQAALAAIQQGKSADGIARHVLWEMRRFAGLQTRLDDLTLIAIKVL